MLGILSKLNWSKNLTKSPIAKNIHGAYGLPIATMHEFSVCNKESPIIEKNDIAIRSAVTV